jgi:ribosome-dependent ATPase
VLRDPVRVLFAFVGSAVMLVLFCYGVSLDVEEQRFAALDMDRSPESRAYLSAFEGSRWFAAVAPPADAAQAEALLRGGQVALTLEIPPGFGRRLRLGLPVEAMATVDGAMPYRGETVEGYAEGAHADVLASLAREGGLEGAPARIESRFRYNQSFESINALGPAMPAMLLLMIPAILAAVSVARERELGAIANFHATPTSRLEFLVGKQAPYVVIAALNFVLLAAMVRWGFGVPLKGDVTALAAAALLFVWASTAFGLLVATATSSQVAAVFATTLLAMIPTVQFSGLLQPVSTLEPAQQVIGLLWPATHFLHASVGVFTKGLGWDALWPDILALSAFGPAFTALAALFLRGQVR